MSQLINFQFTQPFCMKKILSIIAINFVIAIVTAQVNHHIEPVGGSFLPIYTQDSLPANSDIFTNQFLGAGYDGLYNPLDAPSLFISSGWWVNNFIIQLPVVKKGTVYVEAAGVVDISIGAGSTSGSKIMQTYISSAKIDSKAGDTLLIGALPTIEGAVFSHWEVRDFYTGDTLPAYQNTLFNPFEPNTRLIVPGKNIIIKANLKLASKDGNSGGINEGKYFQVDLAKGFINGDTKLTSSTFVYGSKVKITAQAAPDSMIFDRWIGDTACIANMYSPVTEITIPAKNVNILARYRDAYFSLEVYNGEGSGWYRKGDTVFIETYLRCSVFWRGDINHVYDPYSYKTYLVMPAFNIELYPESYACDYFLNICFYDENNMPIKNVHLKIDEFDFGIINNECYISTYGSSGLYKIVAYSKELDINAEYSYISEECECYDYFDLFLKKPNNIVQDIGNQKNVLIFPNPASTQAIIQSNENIQSLSIYNSLGTLVYNANDLDSKNIDVPLHEINPGVYYVHVQCNAGIEVQKLIIEK